MKNNKKRIFKKLFFTSSLVAISPIVFITSCNNNEAETDLSKYSKSIKSIDFKAKSNMFDINEIALKSYDVEITRWIDGDTPIVKILNGEKISGKDSYHVRISAIDTPELHQGNLGAETVGEEFKWAKKAKEFGEKEMPIGTKVKLLTDKTFSYDRIVGSLFYNPNSNNKYKNYSVEILRNGLSLPFFNSEIIKVKISGSLMSITGLSLADAYNYAVQKKLGLFSQDIDSILSIHGKTADSEIRYRVTKKSIFDKKNIYELLKIKYI